MREGERDGMGINAGGEGGQGLERKSKRVREGRGGGRARVRGREG